MTMIYPRDKYSTDRPLKVHEAISLLEKMDQDSDAMINATHIVVNNNYEELAKYLEKAGKYSQFVGFWYGILFIFGIAMIVELLS